MNKILINGSGSSGNNIIIESNGKKLLVDLGIPCYGIVFARTPSLFDK